MQYYKISLPGALPCDWYFTLHEINEIRITSFQLVVQGDEGIKN